MRATKGPEPKLLADQSAACWSVSCACAHCTASLPVLFVPDRTLSKCSEGCYRDRRALGLRTPKRRASCPGGLLRTKPPCLSATSAVRLHPACPWASQKLGAPLLDPCLSRRPQTSQGLTELCSTFAKFCLSLAASGLECVSSG